MSAPVLTLLGRVHAAAAAALVAAAVLLTGHGASAGGAHHLLEALEPPREVSPRAVTMTEAFELVVVVDRGRLIVFLDDAVTNAAVAGAAIELDVGGKVFPLEETAPGLYTTRSWLPGPGPNGLMFSVIAGGVDDLLIVDLRLDGAVPAAAAAPATATGFAAWTQALGDSSRVVTVLLVAGAILVAFSLILSGYLPAPVSRWMGGGRLLPARYRRD